MGDRTPLALETIQSQIKQLTEIRSNCHDDANLVASDENYLLREYVLLLEEASEKIFYVMKQIDVVLHQRTSLKGNNCLNKYIFGEFDWGALQC
ncbi:hypothetical protein R6Q59_029326 [Mikania micrantha]